MSARLIDGRAAALKIKQKLQLQVGSAVNEGKRPPGLAVIKVGEDPASEVYVNNKRKSCLEVGIRSFAFDLPCDITQEDLENTVKKCNEDPLIDGILVQFPLPLHLSQSSIIECIDPAKDVDGFHPYNVGRLTQRIPLFRACTPKGIITLLDSINADLLGIDALVIGASNIVGRPMALELLLRGATVTVAHRFTKDLTAHLKNANLVITAVGKPKFLDGSLIKEGAIVIDVGINRTPDGLCGDVDFESACKKASYITPVPGGVGPMTVASLLENTVEAWERHLGRESPH